MTMEEKEGALAACLSHRTAREVARAAGHLEWTYQIRTPGPEPSWTKSTAVMSSDLMACLRDDEVACSRAWDLLSSGRSVHAAFYRVVPPNDHRGYVAWADVDKDGPERLSRLPFWPSRLSRGGAPRRGHVLVQGPYGGCDSSCHWRHLASYLDGDPQAAHARHSVRLPGLSAVKNFQDADREFYREACIAFLDRWERWDELPEGIHVEDTPPVIAAPARYPAGGPLPPQAGSGVLDPSILLLAERVWKEGSRHMAAVGLAGAMRRAGIPQAEAEETIRSMCSRMGDREVDERLRQVRRTYEIPLDKVAGVSILYALEVHG